MRGGWAAGAKDVARVKLGSASIDGRLCLGLRFQLRVMFRQKRSNVIGHGQQCDPLLLIERDGKATEAIHRHAPLRADLEADGAATVVLQARIFLL